MGSTRPAVNPGDLTQWPDMLAIVFKQSAWVFWWIFLICFLCFLVLKHLDVSGFVQPRTALYWNVLTCPKTYWFVMKQKVLTCTETYRSMLTCTERDWVVPKHTETYWLVLNQSKLYWLSRTEHTELYRKPQPQHHDKTPIAQLPNKTPKNTEGTKQHKTRPQKPQTWFSKTLLVRFAQDVARPLNNKNNANAFCLFLWSLLLWLQSPRSVFYGLPPIAPNLQKWITPAFDWKSHQQKSSQKISRKQTKLNTPNGILKLPCLRIFNNSTIPQQQFWFIPQHISTLIGHSPRPNGP